MQAVWIFLAIFAIFYVISTYFWPIVIIITTIIILCLINKNIKEGEEAERKRQYEAECAKQREAARISKEAAEAEKKRQEEQRRNNMAAAVKAGKDVCWNCDTIQPTRCGCGNCIASDKCDKSNRSDQMCKVCYARKRRMDYDWAVARGARVCDDCLAVWPKRCKECGCCLECRHSFDDLCFYCDHSSDD